MKTKEDAETMKGAVAAKVPALLKDAGNWNTRKRRMGGCGKEE